jgi:exodeoxyribonuclease X
VIAFVIDTESTGITAPKLVQSALMAVYLRDGRIEFDDSAMSVRMWAPGKPIELGALATHGIEDEHVAACDPCEGFQLPEATEYIIGHRIDFDWGVVGLPDVKRICTLALSRKLWPELDSHKLLALMYKLDRVSARAFAGSAHDAGTDVLMAAMLLRQIIETVGGAKDWDHVWRMSEKARIPDVMPFGKHKGTAVKDLPRDYVDWLVRQPAMDHYLLLALGWDPYEDKPLAGFRR